MSKPIHLWSHPAGPNPWKIAVILEELGIPYETEIVPPNLLKAPDYEKINPNGRVPSIYDPNTDLTLWESGAIINYLMEKYDPDGKLHPTSEPDKYLAQQWLFYQVSGQGPYFGQFTWFSFFHSEKVPTAVERYRNEIKRVTKVLDGSLSGKEYLVGNRVTYADLAYVTWFQAVSAVAPDLQEELVKDNPSWAAWIDRLVNRPAVAKVLEEKKKAAPKKH